MQNAIGVDPQFASQVQSSLLCSSCHTIFLPVYDKNGNQPTDEHGAPKVSHEQTTFMEWVNSSFADNGPTPQSCQDCHMPQQYKGQPLAFNIANIEDNTFPPELFRAPDDRDPADKTKQLSPGTLFWESICSRWRYLASTAASWACMRRTRMLPGFAANDTFCQPIHRHQLGLGGGEHYGHGEYCLAAEYRQRTAS